MPGPIDNPGNFTSGAPNVAAVTAVGTNGAKGIVAASDTSNGVVGTTTNGGADDPARSLGICFDCPYGVLGVTGPSTVDDVPSGIGIGAQSNTGIALAAFGETGMWYTWHSEDKKTSLKQTLVGTNA